MLQNVLLLYLFFVKLASVTSNHIKLKGHLTANHIVSLTARLIFKHTQEKDFLKFPEMKPTPRGAVRL